MQVAHVTGEVEFLDSTGGKVERGWAAGQVATTADFSHGSLLWTHFSGGLNYQVPQWPPALIRPAPSAPLLWGHLAWPGSCMQLPRNMIS